MVGPVDVLVIGEALAEFSSAGPLTEAETFRLSFSGDALNVSIAASAAGAHTALVTKVGQDEFGERLIRFADAHGVDTHWISRGEGPTGAYAVGADPSGERAFAYLRSGSAASRMDTGDVDGCPIARAGVVVLSGITAALSDSCARAVRHAATTAQAEGRKVVYDANFRHRLTSADMAARHLTAIAPRTTLLKISSPGDSGALLGTEDPAETVRRCLALGAGAVAVTLGPDGVLLGTGDGDPITIPALPAQAVVDQTGAGDNFTGALAAWLARGASLVAAVRAGTIAATISLGGQGGTGRVATLTEIEALIDADFSVDR